MKKNNQIQKITQLYLAGKSLREIGKEIISDRTWYTQRRARYTAKEFKSLQKKRKKNKLLRLKPLIQKAVNLSKSGKNIAEIARILRRPKSVIYNGVKKRSQKKIMKT